MVHSPKLEVARRLESEDSAMPLRAAIAVVNRLVVAMWELPLA
jgi:hypothetical protein